LLKEGVGEEMLEVWEEVFLVWVRKRLFRFQVGVHRFLAESGHLVEGSHGGRIQRYIPQSGLVASNDAAFRVCRSGPRNWDVLLGELQVWPLQRVHQSKGLSAGSSVANEVANLLEPHLAVLADEGKGFGSRLVIPQMLEKILGCMLPRAVWALQHNARTKTKRKEGKRRKEKEVAWFLGDHRERIPKGAWF